MPSGGNHHFHRLSVMTAAAFAMIWPAVSALGQTAGAERMPGEAARSGEQIRSGAETGQQSLEYMLTAGPPVTYQQVLEHPDDPALNAAYARTQIRRGQLLGASATLERILLTHPEAVDLRLLYGLVLYRLDDLATAKVQLAAIEPESLPPDKRAQRAEILDLIEQRNRVLKQALTLAFGGHFDSNRNAGPSSGMILVGDLPFTLADGGQAKKDYGYFTQGAYDLDYDLGTEAPSSLYVAANLLVDKQVTQTAFDTISESLETGIRTEIGGVTWQLGAVQARLNLDQHHYLDDFGAVARPTARLGDAWDLFGEFRVERQTFTPVAIDPTATDQTGMVLSGWFGTAWRPNPEHRVALALGMIRRTATQSYESYARDAVRLGDNWLLGNGQFIAGNAELGMTRFDAPYPLFSAMTRNDRDLRLSLTYGVPADRLTALAGVEAPAEMRSLVLSVSAEYYRSLSSLTNYTYANWHTAALVTRRWEF